MRVIHEASIYQLIFFPSSFPVNCYIVEESDSLTLVDAAFAFSYKKIIQMADKIGKPITHILITHAHSDHVGAVDSLKELFPNISVCISKRDSKMMIGDFSLEEGEADLPIKGGVPKTLKTKADILLEEGDKIGSLLAIATPGHTPGSFSYLDTRNNAIIVGDAMQTRAGIAVAGQLRPLFPFLALATWNKELATNSAKKIKNLKPTLLATGHGKMRKDPIAIIDRAINVAEQNLKHT